MQTRAMGIELIGFALLLLLMLSSSLRVNDETQGIEDLGSVLRVSYVLTLHLPKSLLLLVRKEIKTFHIT